MESDLIRSLRLQGKACAALGSPFHAALLEHAADDLAAGGVVAPILAEWAEDDLRSLMAAAVPLRLVGALHDLVLSGDDQSLAAAYPRPDHDAYPARAWAEAQRALAEHAPRIRAFMAHEPQTNEVRRSAALLGGFLVVAKETGLPLRCFEMAASAGLNLSWDQYRYRLGEAAWGPQSQVLLPTDWSGSLPPLDATPEVVERAACDRRPTDLRDPAQRRRLLAYIWPDQFERLERIRAAIEVALARGVEVETADAPDWAQRAEPREGCVTVLYHSVFWQYMPPASQAATRQVIEQHAQKASAGAPFAWLRMEPPPEDMAKMEIRLNLWPGGEDRVLAHAHPHGAWVDWLG